MTHLNGKGNTCVFISDALLQKWIIYTNISWSIPSVLDNVNIMNREPFKKNGCVITYTLAL